MNGFGVYNKLFNLSEKRSQNRSIFIANFTKMLFSGLLSAFVITSPKIRDALTRAVLNTIWMALFLHTAILGDASEDGTIDRVIASKQEEAKSRNAFVQSLLPSLSSPGPSGKFFHWYQLPRPWTAVLFETYARKRGVNVFCGEKFGVGTQPGGQCVRLAVTIPETRQDLNLGLAILKSILHTEFLPIDGIN